MEAAASTDERDRVGWGEVNRTPTSGPAPDALLLLSTVVAIGRSLRVFDRMLRADMPFFVTVFFLRRRDFCLVRVLDAVLRPCMS